MSADGHRNTFTMWRRRRWTRRRPATRVCSRGAHRPEHSLPPLRSFTAGANSRRPENHGLTVCISDDAISTGLSCSSERTCAATTSRSSAATPTMRDVSHVVAAAVRPQAGARRRHLRQPAPCPPTVDCPRARRPDLVGRGLGEPFSHPGGERLGWRLAPNRRNAHAPHILDEGRTRWAAAEVRCHVPARVGIGS
jgi:hypothetical protein